MTEWKIHPLSNLAHQYKVNDVVFVRSKSAKELGKRGVIVSIFQDHEQKVEKEISQSDTKKRRRMDSVTTKEATPIQEKSQRRFEIQFSSVDKHDLTTNTYTKEHGISRLVPIYDTNISKIIITRNTDTYRLMASSQIRPEKDCVLEIGCSYGKCTQILSKYAKHVIAIDTSPEALQQAKKLVRTSDTYWKKENVEFRRLDPFMSVDSITLIEMVQKLSKTRPSTSKIENEENKKVRLDCVFIDIGGNRDISPVVTMISWVSSTFDVNMIIVKSEELETEAQHYINATSDQSNHHDLDDIWWKDMQTKYNSEIIQLESSSENKMKHNQNEPLEPPNTNRSSAMSKIHAHPLQAPVRYSTKGDGTTPICRYHNYHIDGCRKGNECPFDHTICHNCLKEGCIARNCTSTQ